MIIILGWSRAEQSVLTKYQSVCQSSPGQPSRPVMINVMLGVTQSDIMLVISLTRLTRLVITDCELTFILVSLSVSPLSSLSPLSLYN